MLQEDATTERTRHFLVFKDLCGKCFRSLRETCDEWGNAEDMMRQA